LSLFPINLTALFNFIKKLVMQVFKFGGASVKDADSVKNVASILKKHMCQQVIRRQPVKR
jgi:hypothetical protein